MSSLKNLKYRSKLEKECHQLLGKKDFREGMSPVTR